MTSEAEAGSPWPQPLPGVLQGGCILCARRESCRLRAFVSKGTSEQLEGSPGPAGTPPSPHKNLQRDTPTPTAHSEIHLWPCRVLAAEPAHPLSRHPDSTPWVRALLPRLFLPLHLPAIRAPIEKSASGRSPRVLGSARASCCPARATAISSSQSFPPLSHLLTLARRGEQRARPLHSVLTPRCWQGQEAPWSWVLS